MYCSSSLLARSPPAAARNRPSHPASAARASDGLPTRVSAMPSNSRAVLFDGSTATTARSKAAARSSTPRIESAALPSFRGGGFFNIPSFKIGGAPSLAGLPPLSSNTRARARRMSARSAESERAVSRKSCAVRSNRDASGAAPRCKASSCAATPAAKCARALVGSTRQARAKESAASVSFSRAKRETGVAGSVGTLCTRASGSASIPKRARLGANG
mmetsp:Transcript_40824/g.94576  ORF Transcript_40824/g.94576 Transcript_40824/m.94576 type:complete len:217 (+) Transcript_40824:1673-2323(+)